MRGSNGTLQFYTASGYTVQPIRVLEFSQGYGLSGSKHQSTFRSVFYPKSNKIDPMQVKIKFRDRTELATFAKFVRKHHREMAYWSGGIIPRPPLGPVEGKLGREYLMHLTIPKEDIDVYGWIESLTVENKGLWLVAPEITFPFQVVYDSRSVNASKSTELLNWSRIFLLDDTQYADLESVNEIIVDIARDLPF